MRHCPERTFRQESNSTPRTQFRGYRPRWYGMARQKPKRGFGRKQGLPKQSFTFLGEMGFGRNPNINVSRNQMGDQVPSCDGPGTAASPSRQREVQTRHHQRQRQRNEPRETDDPLNKATSYSERLPNAENSKRHRRPKEAAMQDKAQLQAKIKLATAQQASNPKRDWNSPEIKIQGRSPLGRQNPTEQTSIKKIKGKVHPMLNKPNWPPSPKLVTWPRLHSMLLRFFSNRSMFCF